MSEIEMKDIILMKKTWNRLEVEVDVDRLDMRTFNPVGSGLETSCVSSICQNLSIPGSCAVRLTFVFLGHSFFSADSFKIVRLLLVLIKVLLLKVVADSVAWLFLPRTSCTFSWRSLSFSTCTPKAIPSNTSVGGRSIHVSQEKLFFMSSLRISNQKRLTASFQESSVTMSSSSMPTFFCTWPHMFCESQ